MLQADPPVRPESTAAEVYGAFQTSSAIEDTPQTKTSLFNFPSASEKDESMVAGGLLGFPAHEKISMQQTARNILFYKVVQFMLIMFMVAGSLFPNHHWVEAMMANTHLASQLCVLLSGLLTHHRYRAFFVIASSGSASLAELVCPGARMSYKIYYRQRILVLLPYVLLAFLWGVPLALARNIPWSIRSILSTLTFTSSLQTMWPIKGSTPPQEVVLITIPFMLLGQCLLYCWILYPLICQLILVGRSFISTRTPRGSAAVIKLVTLTCAIATPIFVSVISLATLPSLQNVALSLKDDTILKDTTTLAAGTTWFVAPLWKFPVFVCGILIAELIHELRWSVFSPNTPDKDDRQDHSFFVRWVLPFVPDLLIFPTFCLMAFDPRKMEYKTNITARALLWCIGKSDIQLAQWTLEAPWILLPGVALMLFLFASPFAHRGVTWKLICQDPILAVLPGRTAIGLSFLTTLVMYTIPEKWHDEIMRGAGLFFILFVWFTPAIAFYYYIYQPWHLWISLKPSSRKQAETEIELGETQHQMDHPVSIKMPLETRDTLAEEDTPEIVSPITTQSTIKTSDMLRVLTSPHYDPFYPKNSEHELRIYKHVASIGSPFLTPHSVHLGFWRWVLALFVETQYVQ